MHLFTFSCVGWVDKPSPSIKYKATDRLAWFAQLGKKDQKQGGNGGYCKESLLA